MIDGRLHTRRQLSSQFVTTLRAALIEEDAADVPLQVARYLSIVATASTKSEMTESSGSRRSGYRPTTTSFANAKIGNKTFQNLFVRANIGNPQWRERVTLSMPRSYT